MKTLCIVLAASGLVSACALSGQDPYADVALLAEHGSCEAAVSAVTNTSGAPRVDLGTVVFTVQNGVALGVGDKAPPATLALRLDDSAAASDADLTPVSRALRGVASCYEARGDHASLVQAFAQLQQIVESPLYGQSSEGEQQRVDSALDHVEGTLRALDPNYQQALAAKGRELDEAKARLVLAH